MRKTQQRIETETDKTVVMPAYRPRLSVEDLTQAVNTAQGDTVVFVFIAKRVSLTVKEGQAITIGRSHSSNKSQPTLDLSKYFAASGISRIHASIWRANEKWFIEDLGSSNGTWVNGERLAPNIAHQLMSLNRAILANSEIGLAIPANPTPKKGF